jgi:hypothetical protein
MTIHKTEDYKISAVLNLQGCKDDLDEYIENYIKLFE